jgi:hypothetical protein
MLFQNKFIYVLPVVYTPSFKLMQNQYSSAGYFKKNPSKEQILQVVSDENTACLSHKVKHGTVS